MPASPLTALTNNEYYQRFVAAMNDDFNTRVALAVMYELVKSINACAKVDLNEAEKSVAVLKAMADILGILYSDPVSFYKMHAPKWRLNTG